MKIQNAINLMKNNISRGILLEGMGCVTFFVPRRDCDKFIELCKDVIPAGVYWSVGTLRDNKITMKKGVYEVGRLRDKSFHKVVDTYLNNGFVETRIGYEI
ncbi:hypothetical protein VPHG_00051 [Vibrio phage 11895-B1]|uniref:hypothetical protein n=1 Tax=Vibrio phage 11895-B1 TaxID=754075 RepID=UPI0002C09F22|nr:hypothetical protein VPHG_00051 [Vibrio phage 11895-B1]AGH32118.1 hypothetical protein VPHG_00051 [Vibrio phage 11895-B1]